MLLLAGNATSATFRASNVSLWSMGNTYAAAAEEVLYYVPKTGAAVFNSSAFQVGTGAVTMHKGSAHFMQCTMRLFMPCNTSRRSHATASHALSGLTARWVSRSDVVTTIQQAPV